jgi:hypothetical protein
MGLFKKKSDPISERARTLNAEIAALEARIKKLSSQQGVPGPQPEHPAPGRLEPLAPSAPPSAPQVSAAQPRLRSTTLPHHRNVGPAVAAPAAGNHEPVFVEMEQSRLQRPQAPPEPQPELGTRKDNFVGFWQRLKTHFRGPPASNPKLVNYLAAGSIQGLRPLRYERRVARNRFLFLVACLVLVLWGLIAVFLKHR